jgi:hypothetical protein
LKIITLLVPFDFRSPETTSAFWFGIALWAAMPETSINEQSDFGFRKYEIRTDLCLEFYSIG